MTIKVLENIRIPSPLGGIELPELEVPLPHEVPEIDTRRAKALRHAIGADIGSLIPIGAIADTIADLHFAEIRKILTKEELEVYIKEEKVAPSTIAMLKTFIHIKSRG